MKVVLTVGATREAIDPVRYISNRSSGKMGAALAQAFVEEGCELIVVAAPSTIALPPECTVLSVETVQQMAQQVRNCLTEAVDIFIGCAAVSDFIPHYSPQKKKKRDGFDFQWSIAPDIIAEVVASKRCKTVIGFAAETENIIENAQQKRLKKGLDIIIANDASQAMGAEDNQIYWISAQGIEQWDKAPKAEVAQKIAQRTLALHQQGTVHSVS